MNNCFICRKRGEFLTKTFTWKGSNWTQPVCPDCLNQKNNAIVLKRDAGFVLINEQGHAVMISQLAGPVFRCAHKHHYNVVSENSPVGKKIFQRIHSH